MLSPHVQRPLGELLVEVRLLPQEVVTQALLEQHQRGGKLGELLVSQGYLSARDVWRALALQLDVPWISLRHQPPQPGALQLLNATQAREMGVLPVCVVGEGTARQLTVALLEPQHKGLVPSLERQLGCQVLAVLCDPAETREALEWYDAFPITGTLMNDPLAARGRGIPPPVELAPILEITAPFGNAAPPPAFTPGNLANTLPPVALEKAPDAPAATYVPLLTAPAPETPPAATAQEVSQLRKRVKDLEKHVQRLATQLEGMLELRMRVAQIESREDQLRSRLQTAVIRLPPSFGDLATEQPPEPDEEPGLTTVDEDDVESITADTAEPHTAGSNLFAQLLAEAVAASKRSG